MIETKIISLPSAFVLFLAKPEITIPTKDPLKPNANIVDAKPNSMTELVCEAIGEPMPKLSWNFNNQFVVAFLISEIFFCL